MANLFNMYVFYGVLLFLSHHNLVSSWDGYLYVSNGTNIMRMHKHARQADTVYYQRDGQIVVLAVAIDADLLFWSDNAPAHHAIYSSRLDGREASIILTDVALCNGLAADWVSRHIYWTDAGKGTLEIANFDGSGRRVLVGSGMVNPRGVAVDPVYGYVFWADQGSKRIERSLLDGTDRQVIVDTGVDYPNQLAISHSTMRLYWVDARRQEIMSCDKDGADVTKEQDLGKASDGNAVFGLAVIGNQAFISSWFNRKISSVFVSTEDSNWKVEMVLPQSSKLYSLVATTSSIQADNSHACGQADKGRCTHLCLPTEQGSFKCACPTFGGLALSFNAKSCEAPSELLFFTLRGSGEVGFISIRGAQSPYLTLAGRSSQPSAVTYDPVKQVVYWSDIQDEAIYYSSLAGKGDKKVFLNGSDGVGIVNSLALDWQSRQLYFTNEGQSSPGLDGATYPWRRLERISLDKTWRKTVTSDIKRPQGLALDLVDSTLFYVDSNKVFKSLLDGSQAQIILDKGLHDANGLSFDGGKLYITDSIQRNGTFSAQLMIYEVSTEEWTPLKLSNNVSLPKGLAVHGDTLYYTDWLSADPVAGSIKSFNIRFGVDNNFIHSGVKPTGMHYSPLARRKKDSVDDPCSKSPCSEGCSTTTGRSTSCFCPDQTARLLSNDLATCSRPKNFLLVADLNTIKMLSLDPDTQSRPHTLYYGNVDTNIIALTFDSETDTLYWSDVPKQSIFSSPLSPFKPRLVYKAHHYIEGMAFDPTKRRLFWTGYSRNGSGVIVRIHPSRDRRSYTELITGLYNPKTLLLYSQRKLMFWTQYQNKEQPACVTRARLNGRDKRKLPLTGLFWPNALAIHKETLFIADGSGKIIATDFDGKEQRDLPYVKGASDHFFGMAVMDNVLLVTKWFRGSLHMVDRITGQWDVLAENFHRPATIILHHPTNLTEENQCSSGGIQCEGSCIPVPRSFHCTCPVGSKLAQDGHSCRQLASPWEITDDTLCEERCTDKAYCSQLIPLLRFQCVCKAGYEGNGIHCTECGADYYKPLLGNSSCIQCPPGSATQGITTASRCLCNNPDHIIENGACVVPTTTSMTSTVTTDPDGGPDLTSNWDDVSTPWTGEASEITSTGMSAPPRFENCPHGDTMLMRLPETSHRVWLTVNWTARDAQGKPLTIVPNVTMSDNKIALPWIANGPKGQQTVRFEARDSSGQTAICQFHVIVEDFVPPKFKTCPHNIKRKTSLIREPITWQVPEAQDNIQTPTVTASHQPKSEFSIGTTHVSYTAMDSAGNRAVCTFNVTLIFEQPCKLPPMNNGRFACGSGTRDICHILCDQGYILNPLGLFRRTFSCMIPVEIENLVTTMKKQEPCLFMKRPKTAHQEMALTFKGPCLPEDNGLKTILHDKVVKALELRRLCGQSAECLHGPITLTCWQYLEESIRRSRRQIGQEERFNMSWTMSIHYVPPPEPDQNDSLQTLHSRHSDPGFSSGQVKRIVGVTTSELKKLMLRAEFIYREKRYVPIRSSVTTKDLQWLCASGEMKHLDGCVACPPGSYMNLSQGECVLCAEGYYQNASGQTYCSMCPEGITVERGAVNSSECVTFPAMNRMSRFIIIVACSFGIIFIFMVICVVRVMHSQKEKNLETKRGGSGNGNASGMMGANITSPVTANAGANPNAARYLFNPNVYVSASTSSPRGPDYIRVSSKECFMNPNDYEDLDGLGGHKTTFETFSGRSPGCRDSFSSFRGGAHTDVTFLGGSSSSPNSNSQSSSGLMPLAGLALNSNNGGIPTSPRGSSKFLMYGDGGYQFSHSPNGTMGSFKGSPSPPPYRSLHIPNGGVNDEGSSPTHSQTQTLTSLLGDDSPYTSRLIRDRLIDPDSPYRIISHDRRPGPESPYSSKLSSPRRGLDSVEESPHHINADAPLHSPGPSRARTAGAFRESPYRSPALQREISQSLSRTPQSDRRIMIATGARSPGIPYYHQLSDPSGYSLHHTFDGGVHPGSPRSPHPIVTPRADDQSSAFVPVGDFLYKRPPSPLSPPISKPKSNESLQRSPSTPRASPGMARKRIDTSFPTPPMNQRRKAKTELGAYEYECEYE